MSSGARDWPAAATRVPVGALVHFSNTRAPLTKQQVRVHALPTCGVSAPRLYGFCHSSRRRGRCFIHAHHRSRSSVQAPSWSLATLPRPAQAPKMAPQTTVRRPRGQKSCAASKKARSLTLSVWVYVRVCPEHFYTYALSWIPLRRPQRTQRNRRPPGTMPGVPQATRLEASGRRGFWSLGTASDIAYRTRFLVVVSFLVSRRSSITAFAQCAMQRRPPPAVLRRWRRHCGLRVREAREE